MHITPDQIVLFRRGPVVLNATILYTWIVMLLLTLGSVLLTRKLASPGERRSRWQNTVEVLVETVRQQIRDICGEDADMCLPFIGTLFLFIGVSNALDILPEWHAPAASLSTTAALAFSAAIAVPYFGIQRNGFVGYIKHYLRPAWVMLPFHLLAEVTRNLALAVRLFGNIMSGSLIVGLLVAIAPLFAPILMQALGLLIGLIQAYIFAVLATVYIAAAVQREQEGSKSLPQVSKGGARG